MKYSDVFKVFESLKCSVWNLVVVEAVKDFSKAEPDSKKFEDACKIVDRLWVTNVSAEDVVVMASGVCYMIDNDILRFDKLPFKRKVIFVHKDMPEVKSAIWIPGTELDGKNGQFVSDMTSYVG